MKYSVFFLFLNNVVAKGCLNDEGTYQIEVKIYLDRDSRRGLTNFTHSALPHELTDNMEDRMVEYEMAHLKHYFGMIFNEVNRTLNGTNVQLRADFSDIYNHEYQQLNERYCGHFKNIIDITENFLADFKDSHEEGINKILIVDCSKNNIFLPINNHFASKNQCGKVHGLLLTDPEIMKHSITEGLYRTFTKKSVSQVLGITHVIKAEICTYTQFCNRNFDHTGVFVKDLGLLTHKTLETGSMDGGLSYNIGKRFVKNFGLYDELNIEYDNGQFTPYSYFHHADNNHMAVKNATYNHNLELTDHTNAH